MNNIKVSYLLYPIFLGIFAAWALTGFMSSSQSPVQTMRTHMDGRGAEGSEPDFGLIIDKNIFNADTSTVKNTLDAVGFIPSGGMADMSGAQGGAPAPGSPSLLGVIKGPYISFAIVSYNGASVVLKQGIPKNGLMLKHAGKTDVTLVTDNGQVIKLSIPKNGKPSDGSTGGQNAVPMPGGQPMPGADGTEKRTISRKEVVDKLSDVNVVMKAVNLSPFDRDGKFVGYRVTKLMPDSALVNLGLMAGDVIIRLNGKELKDPAVFFDALSNAENLSGMTLDLERNNQKKTINVEIQG